LQPHLKNVVAIKSSLLSNMRRGCINYKELCKFNSRLKDVQTIFQ
jgi:hypothetical protein